MKKLQLLSLLPFIFLIVGSNSVDNPSTLVTKLPLNVPGCNSTTTFQLDRDQEAAISAQAGSVLPRNPHALVSLNIEINGRQCISAVVGRNNSVRERSVGGTCLIVAEKARINTVRMHTSFAGGTSCKPGGFLKIEEVTPENLASLSTQRVGFTTIETLMQYKAKVSAEVRSAHRNHTNYRGWIRGVIRTAPSDIPVCVESAEIAVSAHGNSIPFDCERIVPPRVITKFEIEAVRRGKTDYDFARFSIVPN